MIRNTNLAILTLSTVAAIASPGHADKLDVPEDYATIKKAVSAAESGDVIRISAGDYNEKIKIKKKNGITVKAIGDVTVEGLRLKKSTDIKIVGIDFFAQVKKLALVKECGSVSFKDCSFDAPKLKFIDTALLAKKVEQLVVTDSYFHNYAYGIESEWVQETVILNNVHRQPKDAWVDFLDLRAHYDKPSSILIAGNDAHGEISASGWSSSGIPASIDVIENVGTRISVSEAISTIANNTVSMNGAENGYVGIYSNSIIDSFLAANHAVGGGIEMWSCEDTTLTGNAVYDAYTGGAFIGCKGLLVSGNTFWNSISEDIWVDQFPLNTFENNVYESMTTHDESH